MNKHSRLPLALASALLSVVAIASGASYMQLAGELAGKALSPTIVLEYCSAQQPNRAAEYDLLYTEWRKRHAQVLEAIDEQVEHADIRLLRQGAPGGDSPARTMLKSIGELLRRQLETFTPDQAEIFCSNFPAFLESKDRDFETAVPSLLSEVVEADKALAGSVED